MLPLSSTLGPSRILSSSSKTTPLSTLWSWKTSRALCRSRLSYVHQWPSTSRQRTTLKPPRAMQLSRTFRLSSTLETIEHLKTGQLHQNCHALCDRQVARDRQASWDKHVYCQDCQRILEQCRPYYPFGQKPETQRLKGWLFNSYKERYTLSTPNLFSLGFDADVAFYGPVSVYNILQSISNADKPMPYPEQAG